MPRVAQTEPTETAESIALCKWCDRQGLLAIHVPNGRKRDPITGNLLKLMGVKTGFPDYLIFTKPRRVAPHAVGVALELKKRTGGHTRDNQSAWLTRLAEHGWLGTVAEGSQEAVAWLSRVYGIQLAYPLPMPDLPLFLRELDERTVIRSGARCGVAHEFGWSNARGKIIATCDLLPGHELSGDPEHYVAGMGPFREAV